MLHYTIVKSPDLHCCEPALRVSAAGAHRARGPSVWGGISPDDHRNGEDLSFALDALSIALAQVATAGGDDVGGVWDLTTGERTHTLSGHTDTVASAPCAALVYRPCQGHIVHDVPSPSHIPMHPPCLLACR